MTSIREGRDSLTEQSKEEEEEEEILLQKQPPINKDDSQYKILNESKQSEQLKSSHAINISDIRSHSNQSQFSFLRSNKLASISPNLIQNYVSENLIMPDNSLQGNEGLESPKQFPDSYLNLNKTSAQQAQALPSLSQQKQLIKFQHIAGMISDVHNQQSSIQISGTIEYQKEKTQKQSKSISTLRFQDVVFLKFKHEEKKVIHQNDRAGFRSYLMITDNRNQLECRSEDMESMDNPFANFRRCLFRVLNPRVLSSGSLSEPFKKSDSSNLNKKKNNFNEDEDKDEEGGDQLVYGKHMILYHEYSKMYVTFNPFKPAKQNGCVQCSLEKRPNQFSVFRMLPNDYSRRMGDKIYDSDVINIQEVKKGQFFLNVSFLNGLEKSNQIFFPMPSLPFSSLSGNRKDSFSHFFINASEDQTKFKVKCYISSGNLREQNVQQESIESSFKNGDIIKIQHLDSGAFLSLRDKKLSRFVEIKNCRMQQTDEGNQGHSEITFTWKYLDQSKVCSPDNYEPLYDSENLNSSYSYWEIQRQEHFRGGDLYSDECFRLKNLATGLFLAQDKSKTSKFVMTWDGKEDVCLFFVKKDKTFTSRQKIFQADTFKIYNSQKKYFHAHTTPEKGKQLTISLQRKISGVSLPYLHAFNPSEKSVVDFLEQSLQIYNSLLQFHYFLQSFSIDKSKGGDEILYTYQEAIQQQKKLESEHQQVQKALSDLESLLSKKEGDSAFSLQQKQQFLKEQKILEQLVLLARLIDLLTHLSKNVQTTKDKTKLVKISNRNTGYKISEKSPQFIINKHIQHLPIQIYRILYLGTRQNASWSAYIFENDDLFSGQLRHYPKEIGILLKEAVKNLYNFKNENGQGEEIIEWAKLIEPLDSTKQNIQDQTLYVEFLSLAVIDPFQNPLPMYQNKCSAELFFKSKAVQKAIIQFHQGLSISFYHDTPLIDFLANNKSLEATSQDIHLRDRMPFSLEKMCKDSKEKDKQLKLYIQYIAAFIGLLANLCNGRNKKSLTQVKDILGMNENFIFNALKSPEIDVSLKTSLFQLYEVAFLDDEPFLSLSQAECRTYIWVDLSKKTITNKTAEIFNQISDDSDIIKVTQNFDQRILPIILQFWDIGLPELDVPVLSRVLLFNLNQEQRSEKEEEQRWKLKFILNIVRVTRIAMDLGMFQVEYLQFIVCSAMQILTAFSRYGWTGNNEYWFRRFMNRILVYGEFEYEIEALVIEVSNLLRLFLKVKLNLQVKQFLLQFYNEFTTKSTRKKRKELIDNHKTLIQEFEFYEKSSSQFTTFRSKKFIQNPISPEDIASPFQKNDVNSLQSPMPPSSLNGFDINAFNLEDDQRKDLSCIFDENTFFQIDSIGITYLLGKEKLSQETGFKHMIETIKLQMNQASLFCEELQKVELIDGSEEMELLSKFDGNQSIFPPLQLEQFIKNFTLEECSKSKAPRSERSSIEESTSKIVNIIYAIIFEIKAAKAKNITLKYKAQNILRNLRVHHSISLLLELNPDEKVYRGLLEMVVRFLIAFSSCNAINQRESRMLFNSLLNLLNCDFGVEKLLGIILKPLCQHDKEFKPYLEAIFSRFVSSNTNKLGQTNICSLLLSFLKVKNGCSSSYCIITENQQKILNLILQQPFILQFLQSNKTFSDIQKYTKEQGINVKEEIYLYKQLMYLISSLTEHNQLGIVQCQRIMIYEDMKTLLLNPNSPFLIKRELLRTMIAIYIQQSADETNSNFTISEMNDILQNLILRDLTSFLKYIEGIIDFDSKDTKTEEGKAKQNSLQRKLREFITREFQEDKSNFQIDYKLQSGPIRSSLFVKEEQSSEIIASSKEYWDYMYSESKWSCSKDGLLLIIPDCLNEISKRNWLYFEKQIDNQPRSNEEELLSDLLLVIKLQCINMRGVLSRIQDTFGIYNKNIMQNLAKCIIQNDIKKQKGALKNAKLLLIHNIPIIEKKLREGRSETVDAYLKRLDDVSLQEAKEKAQKSQEMTPSKRKHLIVFYAFMEKFHKLIINKQTTMNNIFKAFNWKPQIQSQEDQQTKENFVNNSKEINLISNSKDMTMIALNDYNYEAEVSKENFIILLQSFLKSSCFFDEEDDSNSFGYDEICFFFTAFTTLYSQNATKLSESDTQQLDKSSFLKKLAQYIQLNKQEQNNEQVVESNHMIEEEQRKNILNSFKLSSRLFIETCKDLQEEYPFQIYADQVMKELLSCHELDQRKKIKVYLDQFLTMLKLREDQSFFAILYFVLRELSYKSQANSQYSHCTLALDSIGISSGKEEQAVKPSLKFVRIQQSIIWYQKLYFQILSTLSDIFGEFYGQLSSNVAYQQQLQTEQEFGSNSPHIQQEILTVISKNAKISLYCTRILNELFSLSLKNSHAQLLAILKKPSNIKITRNFLSFLKHSFSAYLQSLEDFQNYKEVNKFQINHNNQQSGQLTKEEEVLMKEEIVMQVLKLIENSCELCNEEFQNFFRVQKVTSSQSYVPLNILSEILYFMSSFAALKNPYFKSFDDQSQYNLRYFSVVNQCIATLKNLCNGTCPKNKNLLLKNTQFLIQLNSIITESNVNLQSENLQDMRTLQTISNCIDLLQTIVVRSNDQNSLMKLISILKTDQLIHLINFIYHFKIKNRFKIIQQERISKQSLEPKNYDSNCIRSNTSFHDQLLLNLGFNIVMAIELILDSLDEDDLSMMMKLQEENSLLLGMFRDMKKKDEKEEFIPKKKEKPISKSIAQVVIELKSSTQTQVPKKKFQRAVIEARRSILFKKAATNHKISQQRNSTTTQHNLIYNEIRDDNSSKNEEFLQLQQLQLLDNDIQNNFTQDRIQSNADHTRSQRQALRESLNFFQQYIGSVEIVKEGQISKIFFRIPLLSSYLSDRIRKDLIHKSMNFQGKNRLKLLIRYSEYFENEMRFCQLLSTYPMIMAAIKFRSFLSYFILVLIIFINLIFLFDMVLTYKGKASLSSQVETVFLTVRMIHIMLSFFILSVTTLERYPAITYQKYKELIQSPTKLSKIVFKIFRNNPLCCYLLDIYFLYFFIYFILTLVALGDYILYAVLLIDIVRISEDMRYFGRVLKLNLQKLCLTGLFCFVVIYIYSLIGAKIFTLFFNSSETFSSALQDDFNLSSYFSVSLLKGILSPEGINEALETATIENNQYWDRFFYDLSFWLLVNFLFLNLMLGQIIDAYAESRYLLRKYEKNIKKKCFVCGLTVQDLEPRAIDWEHHVNQEHNLNNYLNYIIHIKEKSVDDCDGFEKYVKECITKEQPDFFPQRTTLCIQRQQIKQQESRN